MPGIKPGEDNFYAMLFADQVHVNLAGCYLVDLTWYAALLKESPEGKMLPINTELTSAQAKAMQKLAWDVVRNYPDCGLYEDGATPCGKAANRERGQDDYALIEYTRRLVPLYARRHAAHPHQRLCLLRRDQRSAGHPRGGGRLQKRNGRQRSGRVAHRTVSDTPLR